MQRRPLLRERDVGVVGMYDEVCIGENTTQCGERERVRAEDRGQEISEISKSRLCSERLCCRSRSDEEWSSVQGSSSAMPQRFKVVCGVTLLVDVVAC